MLVEKERVDDDDSRRFCVGNITEIRSKNFVTDLQSKKNKNKKGGRDRHGSEFGTAGRSCFSISYLN